LREHYRTFCYKSQYFDPVFYNLLLVCVVGACMGLGLQPGGLRYRAVFWIRKLRVFGLDFRAILMYG
ncbi:MAG: hypothetical protein WAV60_07500, partial [Anaerolineae bacterium]